jgi:hypothetical protein
MASKYQGYWKCEYRGVSAPWTEYYYVCTSAEWYYYSRATEKWVAAGPQTFRSYMGYNMDPHINVDGNRTFRKIPPLEVIVVCGQLCKNKRRNNERPK